MSASSTSPPLALNSCVSCKQGKRKCDRVRPVCSTCSRVGRSCNYEEDNVSPSAGSSSRSMLGWSRNPHGQIGPDLTDAIPSPSSTSRAFSQYLNVDPFLHEALRGPTVDIGMSQEASKILGTADDVRLMANNYLSSMWSRFPIVFPVLFRTQLPSVFSQPHANFIILCLTIKLIMQEPLSDYCNMQSSLYVTVKTSIALLEATNFLTIPALQARLLIAFYEVGHGITPASSISIGGCARLVHAMGLNEKKFQSITANSGDEEKRIAEQGKRARWGTIFLDRFINLQTGYAVFAAEDPRLDDHLPIDYSITPLELQPPDPPIALTTPSDQRVGSFARECQMSHLAGRVLKHVYEPFADVSFRHDEALQLERTLLAFMPLLMEENQKFGLHCAALGICTNALFTLYDSALAADTTPSQEARATILQSIESCSTRISHYSAGLFSNLDAVDISTMSPFTPYSQYRAAIIQFKLWKQTDDLQYKGLLDVLRKVLGGFAKRWACAGHYLHILEEQIDAWPNITFPGSRTFLRM